MENQSEKFLQFVKAHIWQQPLQLKRKTMSHEEYAEIMKVAKEQAMGGILAEGIIESGVHPEREDVMEMVSTIGLLKKRNTELDKAVVWLCKTMQSKNIRIWVFKGQTIAQLYPKPEARSCGDIDFLVHPHDWDKALQFFKEEMHCDISDIWTEKDVSFVLNGVVFEMHRNLTVFAYTGYSRYWKRKVMTEIFKSRHDIIINGYNVPTLPPTYNVLYVFVHIFQHLISDGIGLRQFFDWMLLMHNVENDVDIELLNNHLKGIGMYKAFNGVGALLIKYLGFPSENVFLNPTEKDYKKAPYMLDNIFEYGNFGHNKSYKNNPGVKHGIEHLRRIVSQSRKFGSYSRVEVWNKVPYMFRWWGKKCTRLLKHKFKK